MGVKNFKHFLIFIPKCIESNSESIPKLILVFGLGVTQDPDPIYSFFFGGMSAFNVDSMASDPMDPGVSQEP